MAYHYNIKRNDSFFTEQVRYEPSLHMAPHHDTYSRISIILDGVMNENACGVKTFVRPGNVVIKPRDVIHENFFSKKPVTLLTICFNDNDLFEAYLDHWQVASRPLIFRQAFKLWAELKNVSRERDAKSALESFGKHLTNSNQSQHHAVYWVKKLEMILSENLTAPQHIACLAEKLTLHRVYMSRKFQQAVGQSPIAYRNEARLAKALILIATTDESLAGIAFEAGFTDQSHLSRTVKLALGTTPRAIRKLLQG